MVPIDMSRGRFRENQPRNGNPESKPITMDMTMREVRRTGQIINFLETYSEVSNISRVSIVDGIPLLQKIRKAAPPQVVVGAVQVATNHQGVTMMKALG